jgi:hypothetical protein
LLAIRNPEALQLRSLFSVGVVFVISLAQIIVAGRARASPGHDFNLPSPPEFGPKWMLILFRTGFSASSSSYKTLDQQRL